MASADQPIVVLDSGLGGLTVVAELRRQLPGEDIIYFGDTARLPYGSKSPQTVTDCVRQIVRYMSRHQPKHVLLACNTASAVALATLRAEFPGRSISGVIEPGAKAAAMAAGSKDSPVIGVLATEATIRSRAYDRAIQRRRTQARVLLRAAPLLAPMVEDGRGEDDPLARLAVRQYLEPMLAKGIDVLLLGCTHYPAYRRLFQEYLGPGVPVIDSAARCAEDVHRRLSAAGMLRSPTPAGGRWWCCVSDDPQRFQRLAPRFLGCPIELPTRVSVDELSRAPVESDELFRRRSA
jgi:glutamate racemase